MSKHRTTCLVCVGVCEPVNVQECVQVHVFDFVITASLCLQAGQVLLFKMFANDDGNLCTQYCGHHVGLV